MSESQFNLLVICIFGFVIALILLIIAIDHLVKKTNRKKIDAIIASGNMAEIIFDDAVCLAHTSGMSFARNLKYTIQSVHNPIDNTDSLSMVSAIGDSLLVPQGHFVIQIQINTIESESSHSTSYKGSIDTDFFVGHTYKALLDKKNYYNHIRFFE